MRRLTLRALMGLMLPLPLLAAPPSTQPTEVSSLPITEVTSFKDGHAFVVHAGSLPLTAEGTAMLEQLPTPVLGTFWASSADEGLKLTGVVAGQRTISRPQAALTVPELLEANQGRKVMIREDDGRMYAGTVVRVLTRDTSKPPTPEESARPGAGPTLKTKERSNLVQLATAEGTRFVPMDRIRELAFPDTPQTDVPGEQTKPTLTLHFDGPAARPKAVKVNMAYVQKGFRWIPNYRVVLDGKGGAHVQLQATLINELADLSNATVHLVVGVPSFAFKDTLDPMALQEGAVRLSSYLHEPSQAMNMFSNAIMSQTVRMSESPRPAQEANPLPELPADGGSSDDLFIFTVHGITCRKGDRMVVPVAEFEMTYTDAYRLTIQPGPPKDVARAPGHQDNQQFASLIAAPKPTHVLQLLNKSSTPLTTAPALIIRDGKAAAQAIMTYTPPGSTAALDLTSAVNITVGREESEKSRTPNALHWRGINLVRVDLTGKITLTNHHGRDVELGVTRMTLGQVDSADNDGRIEAVNNAEMDRSNLPGWPSWYGWYSWPWYWSELNPVGRIRWTIKLKPGESVTLNYGWHYFWG